MSANEKALSENPVIKEKSKIVSLKNCIEQIQNIAETNINPDNKSWVQDIIFFTKQAEEQLMRINNSVCEGF